MRRTRLFLPTLKETPAEAQVVSHRLMLRAGLVRQSAAGIYTWLPTGLRVLRKIAQIVREEQDRAGAQEVLMPTIQPAELWRGSGRFEDYGKEMLRITDRHDRELLYGPTAEEVITDIVANEITSYRDLPKNLYNIQWKFRDEVRPRFGVMRGREFLMKDNYSFDLDKAGAVHSYNKMFLAYLRTYARMGLQAIPMAADTGPIGGDLSHEFIILAETGESSVFCDKALLALDAPGDDIDYDVNLQDLVDQWTHYYAATDERHDQANCDVANDQLVTARGIEVGHIFYFGTKYSEPLGATVQGSGGQKITLEMGSYGIGVSRLVGAIIEASHDDNGIIWPESVAPWTVGLINLKVSDADCTATCERIYAELKAAGVATIYDDRDERAGGKFADMDLVGIPWQLTVGPRGLKDRKIEVKKRAGGEKSEVTIDALGDWIAARAAL
ncbi:MAG: proline--tRNA ligase [Alphaproteobacteria bacterium]|nr:proline--tRNA ligase [Alphaproteobacteria bacterium]